MALVGAGTANITAGAGAGWQYDSVNSDLVPVALSGSGYSDLARSVGRQAGSGLPIARALVNQMLPVGTYLVQTVVGAETNTFTTRVAISGTFVNLATVGDAAQTAGTFPAGALNVLGRTIRITFGGTSGTTGTPNWTIDAALGANIVATTGVLAAVATTSPANFWGQIIATVTTVGASGKLASCGQINWSSATNATQSWPLANSTPGTALTIDLTAAYAFTINATCGTSNLSNRLQLTNCVVEVLV